ncbi:MAG: Two component transcriptional regulator, CheY family [Frankiales bacterium]|nr:Two component transcriptional regulator, CheY family [Frankiales bacterium]
MTTIRVVTADDHPPTRAGIRSALEGTEFEVVGEAFTATTAIHEATRLAPDICLVDVRMPGGGVVAVAEISRRLPQTALVMLTVSEDHVDLVGALRAGASGYLLKTIDPDRLVHALRGVLNGEAAIPRRLMHQVLSELRDADPASADLEGTAPDGLVMPSLTSRESQVLEMLRRGLSTADMAEALFVSQGTVRSHVSALLRKLAVDDRESALRKTAPLRRRRRQDDEQDRLLR